MKLLLVALCVAAANAASYTWQGCDTNFANPVNWDNSQGDEKLPYASNIPPTQVLIASATNCTWMPVDTYVPGTESSNVYSTGQYDMNELVLAVEGSILTLSANGVNIVFYPSSQTTGVSQFVGGQAAALDSQACDFNCGTNWVNVATGLTSSLPPCDGDLAIFPAGNSYKVDVEGVVNVAAVQFDGADLTSLNDIPTYAVYPTGTYLQLFLGNNANCQASGTINPATGLCFCQSQCSSAGQTFSSDAQLRAAVKAAANRDLQTDLVATTYPFSASFYVQLILQSMAGAAGLSTNVNSDLSCFFGNMAAAKAAISQYVMANVPGSMLTDLTVYYNSNNDLVTLSSNNFTAQNRFFYNLASYSPNFGAITTEPTGNNMLLVQLWQAIYSNLKTCNINANQATINTYLTQCIVYAGGSTPGPTTTTPAPTTSRGETTTSTSTTTVQMLSPSVCNALDQVLLNTVIGSNNPSTHNIVASLLTDIATYQPSGPGSVFSPSPNTLTYVDPLLLSTGAVETNLLVIADAVLPAKNGTVRVTASTLTSYVNGIISLLAQRYAGILDSRTFPPLTLQQTTASLSVTVGQNLPQADVNNILASPSAMGKLATYISQNLPGTQPIISVPASSVSFQYGTNPSTAQSCVAFNTVVKRRRGDDNTGVAVNPLQVNFNYVLMALAGCTSSSTGFYCPITPSTTSGSTYETVQQILNDLVVSFSIPVDPTRVCANYTTNPQLQTCLNLQARSVFCGTVHNNDSYAQVEAAVQAVVSVVAECPAGGTCTDAAAQAYFNSLAVATVASLNSSFYSSCPTTTTTTTTTTISNNNAAGSAASTSSSGSAAVGAGIGAAIGCVALVVLIIILVVVMRRKRRGPNPTTQKDRNVVAFENPMYDDPQTGGAVAAPVYDMSVAGSPAAEGTGEGLYDEPAFNANKQASQPSHATRENPVYASTENVGEYGEEEQEGGGYLDVAGQDEE